MLKWIAIVTMTIDHIGAILYPGLIFLRIIGRIAFPIFCYLLVLGMETTRNPRNYLMRLLLFAFISQIPFYVALGYAPLADLNVLFTLSFGVLFLMNPVLIIIPFAFSLVYNLYGIFNFDFGLFGILLIASMLLLRKKPKYGIAALILVGGALPLMSWNGTFISIVQVFDLLALPIILLHNFGYWKIERKVNENTVYPAWRKYFFYVYYPLQFIVLHLISTSLL